MLRLLGAARRHAVRPLTPPRPRWLAAVLLTATAAGCDAELYHDLSERRANEALLALRETGLQADKRLDQRGLGGRPSTFALLVPRSEEARALRVLHQRGLPREAARAPGGAGAGKLPLLPGDPRTEAAAALTTALTDTLESLPEVQEARVHLALPEADPLGLGAAPASAAGAGLAAPDRPTAAVLLRLRAPLPMTTGALAELVARAVPGLRPAEVAIVTAPAVSGAGAPGPSAAPAAPTGTGTGIGTESARLVRVGPLWVAAGSRAHVLTLLGLFTGLLALCGVLLRLLWRQRSAPAAAGAAEGPDAAPALDLASLPIPADHPLTGTSSFAGPLQGLSAGPLPGGLPAAATNLATGAGPVTRAPR